MCTFVDSEVVLLNSLRCDVENKGIEYQDIRNYCERVKKMLFAIGEGEINCVSFQISNSSLEEDVETYPRLFRYQFRREDPFLQEGDERRFSFK